MFFRMFLWVLFAIFLGCGAVCPDDVVLKGKIKTFYMDNLQCSKWYLYSKLQDPNDGPIVAVTPSLPNLNTQINSLIGLGEDQETVEPSDKAAIAYDSLSNGHIGWDYYQVCQYINCLVRSVLNNEMIGCLPEIDKFMCTERYNPDNELIHILTTKCPEKFQLVLENIKCSPKSDDPMTSI